MPVLFRGKEKKRRNPPEDPEDFRLTLVEHLEELRDRIIRSLIIIAVAWFVGWELEKPLYGIMNGRMVHAIKPIVPTYVDTFLHAPDAFLVKVKVSFFIGLIPAFPLIVMQIWAFIEPALKPTERKPVRRIAPFSLVLFAMGASFAWFIMPSAMRWFVSYIDEFPGTTLTQEAGTLVFFVLKMMMAFGIAFQLPLVVYLLGVIGLLKAETLIENWRYAATAIFIISMIVTPSNDPATMLMMAIPLVILFAVSVYAVKVNDRRKKKEENRASAVVVEQEDDFE